LKWAACHNIPLLGLSATPLQKSPIPIVPIRSMRELAEMNILAWPKLWRVERTQQGVLRPELVVDVQEHDRMPDFLVDPGYKASCSAQRALEVVDLYKNYSERWGKTLIRVDRTRKAAEMEHMLARQGVRAKAVTGTTDAVSRGEIMRDFRGDGLDVLVVVNIGITGLDVPPLRTVMITHGMGSSIGYIQLIGRAMRRHGEKEAFNVVEMHKNLAKMRKHTWQEFDQFGGEFHALRQEERGIERLAVPAGDVWVGNHVAPP